MCWSSCKHDQERKYRLVSGEETVVLLFIVIIQVLYLERALLSHFFTN